MLVVHLDQEMRRGFFFLFCGVGFCCSIYFFMTFREAWRSRELYFNFKFGHYIKSFQETLWCSFRSSSWYLHKTFTKSGSRLFILSVSKQRESFLVCGNLYFCCLTQMLDSIFKYSLHLGGSLAGFLSVPVEASGYTSSSKLASRSTSSDGSSSLK